MQSKLSKNIMLCDEVIIVIFVHLTYIFSGEWEKLED